MTRGLTMKIGIIGGSGLYDMEGMNLSGNRKISTPFGDPSDIFICGSIGSNEVYFLPRHGRGHTIMPSEINHRANIYGLKSLGVECVLSVSAVGSLQEYLRPRDVILPDQYFDRTKQSDSHTFFGEGLVAHISFGDPTCGRLRGLVEKTAQAVIQKEGLDARLFSGGTYVCMEGPAFSTRAESKFYRNMKFDVIGMTSLPEAKLCREAGMCYQSIAMVTDYDSWHDDGTPVDVEQIMGHVAANSQLAKSIVAELAEFLSDGDDCQCRSALKNAIITRGNEISEETIRKLGPIVSDYL